MKQQYTERGFTFIEILITLAIIGVLVLVGLSVFQASIATYNRANGLLDLEANGNYAMSIIEQRLRQADSIIAYENYASCTQDCTSSWVLFFPTGGAPLECTYIGFGDQASGDPELWLDNGYAFVEEPATCDVNDSSFWTTVNSLDGSPAFGNEILLTNRNGNYPRTGVNVADLLFTITDTGSAPALVEVVADLRQGVTGTGLPVAERDRVQLILETTISLR